MGDAIGEEVVGRGGVVEAPDFEDHFGPEWGRGYQPESSLTLKWKSNGCDQTNSSPFYMRGGVHRRRWFAIGSSSLSPGRSATSTVRFRGSFRRVMLRRSRTIRLLFGRKRRFRG